ncbi:MAG: hypothetical protein JRF40_00815 [Deltaproteobacteria bacterium]|nr:hypothetical protein [Deltaproteobacteria bacterium]
MNKRMNNKMYFTVVALFVSIALSFPGTALAAHSTIEGVIAGANCIATKGTCPMKAGDPHLALEHDFVLSASGGKYYFMPNISRSLKTTYVNKPVRITGVVNGSSLLVSVIEVKEGGAYQEVWNWKKITAELSKGK